MNCWRRILGYIHNKRLIGNRYRHEDRCLSCLLLLEQNDIELLIKIKFFVPDGNYYLYRQIVTP
jgi:hypothetical protein